LLKSHQNKTSVSERKGKVDAELLQAALATTSLICSPSDIGGPDADREPGNVQIRVSDEKLPSGTLHSSNLCPER